MRFLKIVAECSFRDLTKSDVICQDLQITSISDIIAYTDIFQSTSQTTDREEQGQRRPMKR